LSTKCDYNIKYYSGKINTYKLDRTTVTVGAPRTLAMSTSPAGGRLLLRLCGHCLFRSSNGGFRAPLSSRGLALHLR
jgi:hypothetical protein